MTEHPSRPRIIVIDDNVSLSSLVVEQLAMMDVAVMTHEDVNYHEMMSRMRSKSIEITGTLEIKCPDIESIRLMEEWAKPMYFPKRGQDGPWYRQKHEGRKRW